MMQCDDSANFASTLSEDEIVELANEMSEISAFDLEHGVLCTPATRNEILKAIDATRICNTCNTSRHKECNGKFTFFQDAFRELGISLLPSIRNDIVQKLRAFRDTFEYEGSYTVNMYVGQVHQELDDLIDLIIMAIPAPKIEIE